MFQLLGGSSRRLESGNLVEKHAHSLLGQDGAAMFALDGLRLDDLGAERAFAGVGRRCLFCVHSKSNDYDFISNDKYRDKLTG